MICDFNGCESQATIALRMGDGYYHAGNGKQGWRRQTFARYCGPCAIVVREWFITCDERPLAELLAGPAGGGIQLRR